MTSAGGQWNALAHQTIAALLNLFNGACQKCPDVDYCNQVYGNVQTAYESLAADCTATSVNTLLIEALSSFNEGTAGVAQCTDDEAVEVIETLCEAAPDNRKRTGDQTCIRCRSTSFSAASAAYREYGMSLSTTSTLTGWVIGLACIAGVLGVALLVTSIALIRSRRAPTDPFEETE
jgi:hypothetical protein